MLKKLLTISMLTLTLFVLATTTTVFASNENSNKIHLTHKIENPVQGQTYELNGFKYSYSSNKYYAGLITNNPGEVKRVAIYSNIDGVPVVYTQVSSLATYTNLEDVILFNASIASNLLKNISIKNLYMATENVFTADMKTMTIENYHFVAPLATGSTEFDSFNSKSKIDEMNFTNTYYYDYTEVYFQKAVDTYNQRTTKAHNLIKKSEQTLAYTKESFYPFEGFEMFKDEGGIKYYHYVYNLMLSGVTNPTNDDIPYYPYEIDERLKSAVVRNLGHLGELINYTFETLDARGYAVSSTQDFKADKVILSNNPHAYNTTGLKYKEVYFTYDDTKGDITSANGNPSILTSIYIPEDHKEHFSAIIDNASLGPKVKYYTYLPTSTVKFSNNDNTKTYQTMYADIDIDTILAGIEKLESYGFNITSTHYSDNMLSIYNLPTKKNQVIINDVKRLMRINLKKGMDPIASLEAAKEHLVTLENSSNDLTLEYDTTNLKKEGSSTLDVTLNLGTISRTYTVDVHFLDLDYEVAYIETFRDLILVTPTNKTKTVNELFLEYSLKVAPEDEPEIYENNNIDIKKTGNHTTNYHNKWGQSLLHVAVTNEDLSKGYIDYRIPTSYVFTNNIDIDKAMNVIKDYMLYKNGELTKEKFTIEATKEDNFIYLTGKYPNDIEFNFKITYLLLESPIGEYVIIKDDTTNTYTLFVEARTIKEDINAKSIFNSYFESHLKDSYIDTFELPITLTKKGYLEEKITLDETEETFTLKVVVTDNDLNPDDFTDPFKTDSDEFGEISLVTKIKDKLAENEALKWISISVSTLLGIGLIFVIYLIIKKSIKWIKN